MKILIVFAFLSSAVAYAQSLPDMEIRINSTISSQDDYVDQSYVACNIRLLDGNTFRSDIPVVLRNISSAGGRVLFSKGGGADIGTVHLNLNVPRNGFPVTFFVKGIKNSKSAKDKDAVIEAIDNRFSLKPLVLARKAFMVAAGRPVPANLPQIEMQINSPSSLDDYVTWSLSPCRIRLLNFKNFNSPLHISLRNFSGSTGFVNFADGGSMENKLTIHSTLDLDLPSSGKWVDFYISGRFGKASIQDKDAVVEIVKRGNQSVTVENASVNLPDGLLLAREALMVRVRKDAQSITTAEQQRFLNAVSILKGTSPGHLLLNKSFPEAGLQVSGGLPDLFRHRELVFSYEKRLQAIDPAVTLPYTGLKDSIQLADEGGGNLQEAKTEASPDTELGYPTTASVIATTWLSSVPSPLRKENSFRTLGSLTSSWLDELQMLNSNIDHLWTKWQSFNNSKVLNWRETLSGSGKKVSLLMLPVLTETRFCYDDVP